MCVCLGSADEFTCANAPGTDATNECPPPKEEDPWNEWPSYCFYGATPDRCCNCPGGGVHTNKLAGTCQDTHGNAKSDALAYDFLDGCLKWDWFPDTCQWSGYYDDDDFT